MSSGKRINTLSVEEFRELGYLQELNRQFLHPLGLALAVTIDDEGSEILGVIWDCREDPEGITFGLIDPACSPERISAFHRKADHVASQRALVSRLRKLLLGSEVEPIPPEKPPL